ncbi:hypothetical protein EDC96DRAFT_554625 [Choanephora cucurbitarum]|nr:hypothetical protein EDC96DRAFT_554625 [Choanephora cucurbitarum]
MSVFEDGHGNVFDENGGPESMEYIVDQNELIVDLLVIHSEHLKSMPSSKSSSACSMLTEKPNDEDICMKEVHTKHDYVRCSLQDKVGYFDLKIEECRHASATAKQWVKQYDSIFEACKQFGRKCILSKEDKTAVINFIDSSSSASVVEVIKYLLSRFTHLKVSRSNVCNFMKSEFNLSLKKADSHPVEISSRARSKKGTLAIVTRPVTRASTTSIISAISVEGLITIDVKTPRLAKMRYISSGTATEMTLDETDKHTHWQEDTLSKRVTEACNRVEEGCFRDFVSHSYNCLDKCRNKVPV